MLERSREIHTEENELQPFNVQDLIRWLWISGDTYQRKLEEFGKTLNLGTFEHVLPGNVISEVFTGSGLSTVGVFIMKEQIQKEFGKQVNIVATTDVTLKNFVSPFWDGVDGKGWHPWIRFQGERQQYFLDPVYGQVLGEKNKIVLDLASREQEYFEYRSEPKKVNIDFEVKHFLNAYSKKDSQVYSRFQDLLGIENMSKFRYY